MAVLSLPFLIEGAGSLLHSHKVQSRLTLVHGFRIILTCNERILPLTL